MWALVHGDDKLIDNDGSASLFSLASDPKEQTDLAAVARRRVSAMRAEAEALRAGVAVRPQDAPVVETQLPPEAVRALRSLGYIR
jgi:hypothetical protein